MYFTSDFLSYYQKLHISTAFANMKGAFLNAVLALVISTWAAFAVGELHVLALPTFSAVYPGSWGKLEVEVEVTISFI